MNPLGPCSLLGKWGDEIGLSMARCMPAVFDMLHSTLDEKQRRYVAETVAVYAEQSAQSFMAAATTSADAILICPPFFITSITSL